MGLKAASDRQPAERNTLLYSIIIPAYNEEQNIVSTIRAIASELRAERIPFEIVLVNDNSKDATAAVVTAAQQEFPEIVMVHNAPPNGLGRAVRCGLDHFKGDVVAVVMADLSDAPKDVVACYRKIEEGYDCAFGSRFSKDSHVTGYPTYKLVVNRIVNKMIQVMFLTNHNDLTNAFKVYRRHVIKTISPLHAAHFNITIEMSLSALIRRYNIASLPISWTGRKYGASNLKLRAMGRRYLCTLLKIWFERLLIYDDLMAERETPE